MKPYAQLFTVAERNEKGFEPIVIKIRSYYNIITLR